jgi:hypothetical protein
MGAAGCVIVNVNELVASAVSAVAPALVSASVRPWAQVRARAKVWGSARVRELALDWVPAQATQSGHPARVTAMLIGAGAATFGTSVGEAGEVAEQPAINTSSTTRCVSAPNRTRRVIDRKRTREVTPA